MITAVAKTHRRNHAEKHGRKAVELRSLKVYNDVRRDLQKTLAGGCVPFPRETKRHPPNVRRGHRISTPEARG